MTDRDREKPSPRKFKKEFENSIVFIFQVCNDILIDSRCFLPNMARRKVNKEKEDNRSIDSSQVASSSKEVLKPSSSLSQPLLIVPAPFDARTDTPITSLDLFMSMPIDILNLVSSSLLKLTGNID